MATMIDKLKTKQCIMHPERHHCAMALPVDQSLPSTHIANVC